MLVIDMNHAEKRNGQFCCCDKECEDSLSELGTCAEGQCDLLLSVTVSSCTESSNHKVCSIVTDEIMDAKMFGNNGSGYYFISHFTTTSQANNVRKCFQGMA